MSYQAEIYQAVRASIVLNDLIGDRFSWDIALSGTAVPYVVAQTITDAGRADLSGDRELSFPLLQFAAWAHSKREAISISEAFKNELEGKVLPGQAAVVLSFATERSFYDSDSRLFGNIVDYRASVYMEYTKI